MKDYKLIDHTADLGVKLEGGNLKELFKNAALAMFDIIAQKEKKVNSRREKIEIAQEANDLDELFINWLNELLSLSAIKDLIFDDFDIKKIDSKGIKAIAWGQSLKNYKVNTEIKAATYHDLKIEEKQGKWQAEVIFDV